ncbi:MAG: hypothetical protein CR954_00595 [Candidatus Moraniibacteriota bacterium]|nr:MAG: hypothetical protein CR954_00595 [Candidatus Moranbacteria bacterium]
MHDILIKNGTIYDGTGRDGFAGDIAITDGRITEIGDLAGDGAHEVIDAHGLYVAPGFIDISNRTDTRWRFFSDRHLESMLYQGVTTIIGGNSGSSLAPIYNDDMLKSMRKWADVGAVNVNWQTMAEFLDVVANHRLAVNFGSFVGYGTLRRGLTGDDAQRALTKDEKTSIQKHLAHSLDGGALGVSTGLVYSHEQKVTQDELEMIGRITAKHNKLFVAHLRDEADDMLDALDEMIAVQENTKTQMHISHLKAMGKTNWTLMEKAIARIEKTDVVFDLYPYTFTESVLYTFLPRWVSDGGRRMMLDRLRSEEVRAQVVKELNTQPAFAQAIVARTKRSHYFCGKTFGDIARTQKTTVGDVMIDVLLASDGQVMIFLESVSRENIMRALASTHAVISTNGIGFTIEKYHEQLMHPRSFGAFPHVFAEYVTAQKTISVAEMIYKSSGKVAEELHITDRGVLDEGRVADIVVFDPAHFRDYATPERPYQYAKGVQWLLINGQTAVKYGKSTGVRAGEVIRG